MFRDKKIMHKMLAIIGTTLLLGLMVLVSIAFWLQYRASAEQQVRDNRIASSFIQEEIAELMVKAGANSILKRIETTGDWGNFKSVQLGKLVIDRPGQQRIEVGPKDAGSWKPINLRFLRLTPASE